MKKLGMPLFILGVIIASCYAARPVTDTVDGKPLTGVARIGNWAGKAGLPAAMGLVLVVFGGLLARSGRKGQDGPSATPSGGDPRAQLDAIRGKIEGLDLSNIAGNADALHKQLDAILEEDVPAFLEHRQGMIDKLGLAGFAEMIGQFAGMERNTARAWSAITDEVFSEVPPCIDRAKIAIGHAVTAYDKAS